MSLVERQPTPISEVTIREFLPGDEDAFYKLSEEWIARYFYIEPKDEKTLRDPQRTILDVGGKIYFATVGERCVGCCALLPMSNNEFEIAKVAVTESYQERGIGRKLMVAAIEAGRNAGARRLYLECNHTLTSAMRLYLAVGFKHLPPDRVTPSPYERSDVYMEMMFEER
jgi:GNAT superfamily N-acetyltransferase